MVSIVHPNEKWEYTAVEVAGPFLKARRLPGRVGQRCSNSRSSTAMASRGAGPASAIARWPARCPGRQVAISAAARAILNKFGRIDRSARPIAKLPQRVPAPVKTKSFAFGTRIS